MNYTNVYNYRQPTILIVSNSRQELTFNSPILASFNLVNLLFQEPETLSWIQQHQPDLIVLDLEWSQLSHLQLVTNLKLDWLTRDIPVVAIVNSIAQQHRLMSDINYDGYSLRPYSIIELEKHVCSLIATFDCQSHLEAINISSK